MTLLPSGNYHVRCAKFLTRGSGSIGTFSCIDTAADTYLTARDKYNTLTVAYALERGDVTASVSKLILNKTKELLPCQDVFAVTK